MHKKTQDSPSRAKVKAYKKAGFFERLGAAVIDMLLLFALFVVLIAAFNLSETLRSVMVYVLAALYGALFLWRADATPGKMLFKLKVVTTTYKPISFWRAVFRESLAKDISALLLYMGYLWMLRDKKNQTWHDKLAKTYVVKLGKSGQLIPLNREQKITQNRKVIFWILFVFNPLTIAILILTYLFFFSSYTLVPHR